MANKFVDKETADKTKKRKQKKAKAKKENNFAKSMLQVVNGDILTREFVIKNLPFLVFLSVVLVVYTGYGYHTQKVAQDIRKLEKEILELNAEEVTLRSDLNKLSRQETIAKKLKGRNIKESKDPLKIISIEKESE